MTKKEFIERYNIKKTVKNVGVVDKLEYAGKLCYSNFLEFTISQREIAEVSGCHKSTIEKYDVSKRPKEMFLARAIRTEAIRILTVAADKKLSTI